MSTWTGKSKGNLSGHKIFVWTIENFGIGSAYFLLRFVSVYFVLFSPGTTSSLYYYFRQIHRYSLIKTVYNIYNNYFIFGQTLIDRVYVLAGNKDKFTYSFEGEENLLKLIENKTGGILISTHAGNWEIAGHALKNIAKIHIVAFEGEHAAIKRYLAQVKKENDFNFIIVNEKGIDHIYKINEALENKELICIHGDRFMNGTKTAVSEFLGGNAEFPLGPFILAAHTRVPVLFVYAMKEGKYHYHLSSSKAFTCQYTHDRAMREKEALSLRDAYLVSLENIVLKYPAQWFNYYKFWITKNSQS